MTLHSLENFVPSLLSRPKSRPWMTRELLRTIKRRDRAYQAFRQYPYTKRNLLYLERLKKAIKAKVDTTKRNFIECHITNELQNGNSKPLYNFISKSREQSNYIGCLENTLPERIPDYNLQIFPPLCLMTTLTPYQTLHYKYHHYRLCPW